MTDQRPSEAWVNMSSNEALAARRPAGSAPSTRHPYDFGFRPAMARLVIAHPRIGAQFGAGIPLGMKCRGVLSGTPHRSVRP